MDVHKYENKSRKPGFRNTVPERKKGKQNPAKMLEVFDFFKFEIIEMIFNKLDVIDNIFTIIIANISYQILSMLKFLNINNSAVYIIKDINIKNALYNIICHTYITCTHMNDAIFFI